MLHFRKQGAFTLIELLIVVAIIAILAAIAVPNFLEAQTRAKVSRAKSDMRTLATALESYYVDNNNYVPSSPVSDGDKANEAFHNVSVEVPSVLIDALQGNHNKLWKMTNIQNSSCQVAQSDKDALEEFYGDTNIKDETGFQRDLSGAPGSWANAYGWISHDGTAGFFKMLSTPISYISDPLLEDPWLNKSDGTAAYVKYVACNKFMPIGFTQQSGTITSGPLSGWFNWTPTQEITNGETGFFPTETTGSSNPEKFDALEDSQVLWWALYVVGPDKTDSIIVENSSGNDERQDMMDMWSSSADASGPSVAEMVGAHVYDPTNGTKSSGEIWRIGGGRPSTELPMENYDGDKLEDDDAYSATGLIHQHLSQMVK